MSVSQQTKGRVAGPLTGAAIFLLAYLAVSPAAGGFADRELPLPGSPGAEVVAYYAANPAATVVAALLQVLSVAGLLAFARSTSASGGRAALAGLAVTAMVVSSVLSGVLAVVADGAAESTVVLLRQLGFYAGGVVHVVALGGFVVSAAAVMRRDGVTGRGVRIFGYVAGALALLSVLSVAVYYANALLPLGRVLCMVWTVAVGVSWWRRRR